MVQVAQRIIQENKRMMLQIQSALRRLRTVDFLLSKVGATFKLLGRWTLSIGRHILTLKGLTHALILGAIVLVLVVTFREPGISFSPDSYTQDTSGQRIHAARGCAALA